MQKLEPFYAVIYNLFISTSFFGNHIAHVLFWPRFKQWDTSQLGLFFIESTIKNITNSLCQIPITLNQSFQCDLLMLEE
jgi:hypothetical protein